MNTINGSITCADVKGVDMVGYLSQIGYEPQKIRGFDYWYLSPLRTERTASFKVSKKGNVWFDHGIGKGGTLIDFCLLYYNCSIRELLQRFDGGLSFHQRLTPEIKSADKTIKDPIQILAERQLSSLVLQRYLSSRKIPLLMAQKYCCELVFLLNKNQYRGIGFKNTSGGFEIRNSWFKGSAAPKGTTLLQNEGKNLAVFDGFFDLLSYCAIYDKMLNPKPDFLVLNSTAFFDKALSLFPAYKEVHLYLDEDNTGRRLTQKAVAACSQCLDNSAIYKGYKDLNEWHCHIGKGLRSSKKQRNI